MSGFDGMRQSQAQASQASQHYDDQRYESMRQTGQSVMQLGQFGIEVQQLATEQAMRVQEHEIQMQQSMAKLQSMNMMNESDMLRQQVRGAKLQNDAMEAENKNRSRLYESQYKESAEQTRARLISAMGGAEGLLIYGFDENLNPIKDEKELEKRMSRAQALNRHGSNLNENVEAKRFQNEYSANLQALSTMIRDGASDEEIAQQQELLDLSRANYREARGLPAASGGGTKKPQPPKLTDDQRTLSKSIREKLGARMGAERTRLLQESSANNFSGQIPTLPEGSAQKVADFLASQSEMLRVRQQKGYDADPKRKGLVATHESAVEEIISILSKMSDPRRQAVLAYLQQNGAL